jgi:hypothetical protein
MRRMLAISIFLICLTNLPWVANLNDFTELLVSSPNYSSGAYQVALQQVTPAVIPATQKPVKTPHITPTHTPRPTAPPPEIPPPTDKRLLHSMILFAVIASLTIVFGLWTNRQRINPR